MKTRITFLLITSLFALWMTSCNGDKPCEKFKCAVLVPIDEEIKTQFLVSGEVKYYKFVAPTSDLYNLSFDAYEADLSLILEIYDEAETNVQTNEPEQQGGAGYFLLQEGTEVYFTLKENLLRTAETAILFEVMRITTENGYSDYDDPLEYNNDIESATPISLPYGSGESILVGRSLYDEPDEDWYEFSLTAGQEIEITIGYSGFRDLDITLLDKSGNELKEGGEAFISGFSKRKSLEFTASSSSTFFAKVSGESGSYGTYSLSIN